MRHRSAGLPSGSAGAGYVPEMLRLFISAAEHSGDTLGAELLAALRARGVAVEARGVAGPHLRAAGVRPVAFTEDISVMGITAVLRSLPRVQGARQAAAAGLRAGGIDAAILIDAPDFHLPLGRLARSLGIPAIGYVSPQVWAWRRGRTRRMAAALDMLLCLFAFEPPLYPKLDARWVGHPVRDRVPLRAAAPDPDLYALLPGSRRQELRRHLGPFLDAAARLHAARPQRRFLLPLAPDLRPLLPVLPDYVAVTAPGVAGLAAARGALTKSGTITLELAAMGVPQVVAHRVHPLTHWIGRRVVTGVQHLALPNILAGRMVVPEFVQHFDAATLAAAVEALPAQQAVDLSAIGQGGAAHRAAEAVVSYLEARQR